MDSSLPPSSIYSFPILPSSAPSLSLQNKMSSRSSSSSSRRPIPNPAATPATLAAFLRGERVGADAPSSRLDALRAEADTHFAELSLLLQTDPPQLWDAVQASPSLHRFMDDYLRFSKRSGDKPEQGPRGSITGKRTGEVDLCRHVLLFLHRISCDDKDGLGPGRQHEVLLEKKWLDLPKLMDICVLYSMGNAPLVREVVSNAIQLLPNVLDNMSVAVSHFLSTVNNFYHRSMASFKIIASSTSYESDLRNQLEKDFMEVDHFINDAIITMDYFINAYNLSAFIFSSSSQLGDQNEDILNVLGKLHDTLIPLFKLEIRNVDDSLKSLRERISTLGQKILVICYLNDDEDEENLGSRLITKLFPTMVHDPTIRGEIILHTLKKVNEEISYRVRRVEGHVSLLQSIEIRCGLLDHITRLREKGWIILEDRQFSCLSKMMTPPPIKPRFFP